MYSQTEDKVRGLCRGLRLLSYKLETRLPIWKTAFLLCDYILITLETIDFMRFCYLCYDIIILLNVGHFSGGPLYDD